MSDLEKRKLFTSIRKLILEARERVSKQVNAELILLNWNIGKLIVEDEQGGQPRAQYGKEVLKKLSKELMLEFGAGFDYTNLTNIRKFYLAFPKVDALRQDLSWTHYRLLSRIEKEKERHQYLQLASDGNWNTRDLERNIRSGYLGRLLEEPAKGRRKKSVRSIIKDPYIFEFLGLRKAEKHLERTIESALIDNLQSFLVELGKGFSFVERQQHIVTDTSDFFIDLVFYNYHLKCFVLIDLKIEKLKHEHIGQMDMYVRMYDDLKREEGDNPTIGIVLCTEKDETIVKYSVLAENKKLFASRYRLYMPDEKELEQMIDEDRRKLENR